MTKKLLTILFLLIPVSIFSFGKRETTIELHNNVVAGLILNESGLGDGSINDECSEGLTRAVYDGHITFRTLSTKEGVEIEDLYTQFKAGGVDYTYLLGEENRDTLISLARANSSERFIGIDMPLTTEILPENSLLVNFREADGGYIAGIIAGSLTYRFHKKSETLNEINRLGVIISSNNPENQRYELGFYAGVKEVNAPCDVITVNINSTDPNRAYSAAMELKEKGVDIIFTVAGDADSGVFKAAEESDMFVIGSHRDVSSLSPKVLTSVVKNISEATYLVTKGLVTSELFEGSSRTYGLQDAAIKLAPFYKYDSFIPGELTELIKSYKDKLIKNPALIPDSKELVVFNPEEIPEIVE